MEFLKVSVSTWLREYWRPLTAATYLIICLFDFLVAPVFFYIYDFYDPFIKDIKRSVLNIELNEDIRKTYLTFISNRQKWQPLTLQEGALFHFAFGAILTGAAITRGMMQIQYANRGIMYDAEYYRESKNYNHYHDNNHHTRQQERNSNIVDNPDSNNDKKYHK